MLAKPLCLSWAVGDKSGGFFVPIPSGERFSSVCKRRKKNIINVSSDALGSPAGGCVHCVYASACGVRIVLCACGIGVDRWCISPTPFIDKLHRIGQEKLCGGIKAFSCVD